MKSKNISGYYDVLDSIYSYLFVDSKYSDNPIVFDGILYKTYYHDIKKWKKCSYNVVVFYNGESDSLADVLDLLSTVDYLNWSLTIISYEKSPDPLFDEIENICWCDLNINFNDKVELLFSNSQWVVFSKIGKKVKDIFTQSLGYISDDFNKEDALCFSNGGVNKESLNVSFEVSLGRMIKTLVYDNDSVLLSGDFFRGYNDYYNYLKVTTS